MSAHSVQNRATRRFDVVLIQSALGDYRAEFLAELRRRLGDDLRIAAGAEHFDASVLVMEPIAPILPLRNQYLLRRRALWQRGALAPGVGAGVAILEFNPRILSVWATLVIRSALRRRTILWGHAFPRHGPSGSGMLLRRVMRALAEALVVYTRGEAVALRSRGTRRLVVAAHNAIYSAREMTPASSASPHGFIYVGRLVKAKKPAILIDALARVRDELGEDARLAIVGDGPLRLSLEAAAAEAGLSDIVHFHGHVSDRERLRDLYGDALASISPGYVGLSITQSLGFGLPMIVSRDEPHAPEIEAALEGETAVFFQTDNPVGLAESLVRLSRERNEWLTRRTAISAAAAHEYSAERMAACFIDLVRQGDGLERETART